MSIPLPGDAVALGLLAGPAELALLRRHLHQGWLGRLWRAFMREAEESLAPGKSRQCAHLALLAAVTRDPLWATRATEATLELAHLPTSAFIHPEAGCMTLTGMHRAHQLALAIDWLWPVLNRDQREATLGALLAKTIENLTRTPDGLRDEDDGRGQLLMVRRMDRHDAHCLHPHDAQVNNWDLWFAGGIYLAARLAERAFLHPRPGEPTLQWGHYYQTGYALDEARIARWLAIARERIQTALRNQVGEEGDYAEGVSYAAYGGEALVTALTALRRLEQLDLYHGGVLRLPHWRRNQFLADLPWGGVNFNDALQAWRPATALTAHIARYSRDPLTQGILLEELEHDSAPPSALLLTGCDPELPATLPALPRAACYRRTGTVIWRTASDRSGLHFALQSGAHGGAHQHRDRNTFFLAAHGDYLLVDTGDCRYLQPPDRTFAETLAHNCLLIDGRGQLGDSLHPVGGQVLEHRDDDTLATLLADAAACYEGATAVRRRAVLLRRAGVLALADRVTPTPGRLSWLLQGYNRDAQASWQVQPRQLTLHRPTVALHIFLLETPLESTVTATPLDGEPRGILRLRLEIPGDRVTALLVPTRGDEAPPQATWAPDGTLSVTCRGIVTTLRATPTAVRLNDAAFAL